MLLQNAGKAAGMAYFLKRTNTKKGLYLQIYESFYDPARRQTCHRSVRALGYEAELREAGVADPVAHFRAEVDAMNAERRAERDAARARRVAGETPERALGYFPLKAVNEALGAAEDLRYLQLAAGFRFDLADMLSSLVYARAACPCSKSRTFGEVLPLLAEPRSFSLDQLYDGLAFVGAESRKVVEIYSSRAAALFGRDSSRCYFDCTNFFFEVDREDERGLRRKGPSKEGRKDPIVSLGLLLDADCVPVGMSVFAGNESEKPQLREVVAEAKRRGGLTGRTVRVADKGLNCAANVADAVLSGDGYVFSKSVRQLPEAERAWALSGAGWEDVRGADGEVAWRFKEAVGDFRYEVEGEDGRKRAVELPEKRVVTYNPRLARKQLREIDRQVEKARSLRLAGAKRSEYGDSARFVEFAAVDGEGEVDGEARVVATLNRKAIEKARACAGHNMIVTSETSMPARGVYETYHRLWRIEESFRAMKSQLDARPVYLQRTETIVGHFVVCYIAVLLLRLLQVKVLGDSLGTEELVGFVRGFRVVEASERRWVNISRDTPALRAMEGLTGLPLGNYNLTKGDVDRIAGWKLTPEKIKAQLEKAAKG